MLSRVAHSLARSSAQLAAPASPAAAMATRAHATPSGVPLPIMGRARRGLYHGKTVGTGHNVSHSKRRTNRLFRPNVHTNKRFASELLGRQMSWNVSSKALRTIDKYGGIDQYLMRSSDATLGNQVAIRLKRRLRKMAAPPKAE